jgi:integrase
VPTPCQQDVVDSPAMASIRERPTASGEVRHVVQFRQAGRQTTETFLRRRDAEKFRDFVNALGPEEARARLAGKAAAVGEMSTVAEWLERHITDLTGVTDRTRADYRAHAARHIAPMLGPLDVDEVTTSNISAWANQLERKVSAKTVANLRGLLSAAFGYAIEQGLRQDNPMRRLRRTRSGEHERAEMVCLTPQEFGSLRALLPERWRPFATVLAGTGLRFGEAIALTVRDVDLLAITPALKVTKALQRVPGGFEVGPPKTRKSRRTVSLSDDLVDVLAPLVTRPRDELLFVGPTGARVHHPNFYNRAWRPAVATFAGDATVDGKVIRGDGRRPRIHDLRHSHASWLIAAGVPLPAIRDRLGHESINTTVDVYGHLLPDQHRVTAAALNGLLADGRTAR